MANTATVAYQKDGINFKTSVFNVALTGNYAAPETFTLTSGGTSNPQARIITGPEGAAKLQPRTTISSTGGVPGFTDAQLVPTATAGQYSLYLSNGATAFAGAYANSPVVTVEIDHDLQGY